MTQKTNKRRITGVPSRANIAQEWQEEAQKILKDIAKNNIDIPQEFRNVLDTIARGDLPEPPKKEEI